MRWVLFGPRTDVMSGQDLLPVIVFSTDGYNLVMTPDFSDTVRIQKD